MTTITVRKSLNGLNTVGMESYIDETEFNTIVEWLSRLKFSRPKTTLEKDFEDGVLIAEIVKHYFPKMVELHNYNPASSTKQKLENWYLLNRRVLKRLGMDLSDDVIRALANRKPHVIERILIFLRMQIDNLLTRQGRSRREIDLEFASSQQQNENEKTPIVKDITSPKENAKHQKDPNSQALVAVGAKTGRASPSKSPRKKGDKGETDRSRYYTSDYLRDLGMSNFIRDDYLRKRGIRTYFSDKRMIADSLPIYSYMYPHSHVPRFAMEEKEIEIMQKDETIQMLNAKIQSMERLLSLKQVRIEDLHAKLIAGRGVYYVTEGGTRKIIR
ncbi:sperm flagellar protein 1-like isoform X7 [Argopecten irradians]|uniref:sperm flagellar protein 1-like isoform X7 n=1 Tax=Argopecten irradians TaxID=31199 RepID=UPI00371999B6